MTEEEIMNAGVELRRKLMDHIKEFWKGKENLPMDQIFFMNSIVISSLVSQITFPTKDGWISMKDEPPQKNGYYNVFFKVNDHYRCLSSALYKDGDWIDFACLNCGNIKVLKDKYVTHFRPLPEPPQD